jgi:uncharacterized protein YndB with AHSA1/START domain
MQKENIERTTKNETSMELQGDRIVVITRRFNGPARIVFDAWTKPEFVKRWWAPASHCVAVVSCEADVRVGGRYRYALKQSEGEEFAFSGEYREVTPHSRLVYTQLFEPMAEAGAVVVTITLKEERGKTLLVAHEAYPSAEARDAALASGMEHGMRETMDQLDELVASLR